MARVRDAPALDELLEEYRLKEVATAGGRSQQRAAEDARSDARARTRRGCCCLTNSPRSQPANSTGSPAHQGACCQCMAIIVSNI